MDIEKLFQPIRIHGAIFPNRIVMAPMGRLFNDEKGVPHQDYIEYFRRRAAGGTGVLMTEGSMIPHPVAAYAPNAAAIYGEEAMAVWRDCADAVHAHGATLISQIWHGGLFRKPLAYLAPDEPVPVDPHLQPVGPSGWHMPNVAMDGTVLPGIKVCEAMSEKDIEDCILAFGEAAVNAKDAGFDAIDIHAAHGYLIDQFLWERTNERTDQWGGSPQNRVRFAVEVTREVRRRVGPDYPVFLRLSQWKQADYGARLANTPQELEALLVPLADAGVDVFDCSTRRIWEPEFADTDLTIAGWCKKLTGKLSMAVGSVGLERELNPNSQYNKLFKGGAKDANDISRPATEANLERVLDMFEKGWFDFVGVGRMLIADPAWADKVRHGRYHEIPSYNDDALATLL